MNDAVRRADLINAAADYILECGLADLSVRPLAAALGLSHRTLLYHFESKDRLLLEVIDVIRERDKARIRELLGRAASAPARDVLRAAWAAFSVPERMPYIRFFHEVLALGLQGPPYDAWAERIADSRTDLIVAALGATGVAPARARPLAILITAAVRGLQLHLLTTDDRAITDAAFEELLTILPE